MSDGSQPRLLPRSAANYHLEQLERQNDQGDHEQEMDYPATNVEAETEKPEHEQNENDGPKHYYRLQLATGVQVHTTVSIPASGVAPLLLTPSVYDAAA